MTLHRKLKIAQHQPHKKTRGESRSSGKVRSKILLHLKNTARKNNNSPSK
jgi:hypothetical protein